MAVYEIMQMSFFVIQNDWLHYNMSEKK